MADPRPPIAQTPKLVTEEQAPDNLPDHGKTPASGIVNPYQLPQYVKAKVSEGVSAAVEALTAEQQEGQKENGKKRRRATVGSVGAAGLLTVLGGFYFDWRHAQRDDAREEQKAQAEEQRLKTQETQKTALQKQLDAHIKTEDEHYQATKDLLNRLLDHELNNKR